MAFETNLTQHNSAGASKGDFNDDPLSCEIVTWLAGQFAEVITGILLERIQDFSDNIYLLVTDSLTDDEVKHTPKPSTDNLASL